MVCRVIRVFVGDGHYVGDDSSEITVKDRAGKLLAQCSAIPGEGYDLCVVGGLGPELKLATIG